MRAGTGANDLARTVTARIAALGLTHQAVADRCTPPLLANSVTRIAAGSVRRPGDATLAALAVGLGLPEHALHAAMHRPPRPASEAQADLPADLVAAFSRAQRRLSAEELADFYANLRDMADLVSRSYADREYGPTNYRPPEGEPAGAGR